MAKRFNVQAGLVLADLAYPGSATGGRGMVRVANPAEPEVQPSIDLSCLSRLTTTITTPNKHTKGLLMAEYTVVKSAHLEKLIKKVNERLFQGWIPQGGVMYHADSRDFLQAMLYMKSNN